MVETDTDGDGYADEVAFDTDGDGYLDTVASGDGDTGAAGDSGLESTLDS